MYWVYVLRSIKDKKYYIGQTNNIDVRFIKHNNGKVKSTKSRLPLELIFSKEFNTRSEAIRTEKRLKGYKNSKYLKYLINKGLVV
ncbi:hypothetical protein A2W14_01455 [Candidatus Gottesmanbacteria bacterium RBG_16_37_8]|uniref:GIY-YIG domain-containing protein n=1 Tax=Candidatus Gottesmanbacteria bacterium RBG_16_37_8 TaxID=1798371 RepID=A0A1F5YP17_9BACT|nr:MAG: hypothetical protein A2W14_01455 [Candidatus Gottesmanbacteria bacterium RBG_16_37_8]